MVWVFLFASSLHCKASWKRTQWTWRQPWVKTPHILPLVYNTHLIAVSLLLDFLLWLGNFYSLMVTTPLNLRPCFQKGASHFCIFMPQYFLQGRKQKLSYFFLSYGKVQVLQTLCTSSNCSRCWGQQSDQTISHYPPEVWGYCNQEVGS